MPRLLRNLLCLLALAWAATAFAASPGERFSKVAHKLLTAINADDQRAIQHLFDSAMRQALPPEKASTFFHGLIQAKGKLVRAGIPRLSGPTAVMPLRAERGRWEMRLTLDEKNAISGLIIVEPQGAEAEPVARTRVPLRLPFREEWSVFWGGPTETDNYHVKTRNQRRALDLIIEDRMGKSFRNSGTRNEDYYCYGKDVLAPADGTVVTTIDGVPDNAPHSMNPYSAVGNCIIIRHNERECSVLAHLQPYSMRVKLGDRVHAGQLLGKCGNSGNSSEPHLHFHVQDSAVLQDGAGLTPYFQHVVVTKNGHATSHEEYTPVRGDRLKAQ